MIKLKNHALHQFISNLSNGFRTRSNYTTHISESAAGINARQIKIY